MKILITNHHLDNRAGSELFVESLALELKKRGHMIFIFSPVLGEVSDNIKSHGIKVSNNIRDFEGEEIDVVHAQHNVTTILARSIFPETPIIFMSHGVLPDLEQPPSIELGILKFIVVSEEIRDHLVNKYDVPMSKISIIRNFVDLDKFISKKDVNEKLEEILIISNHYTKNVKQIIKRTCEDMGIGLTHVGLPENPVDNVEDYINKADLVITLGRGALESMSCERNVIIYDVHGGDGFVNDKNFYEIRKNNFSGRKFGNKYSAEDFKLELEKYNPNIGKKLREIVKRENSLKLMVDELEVVYCNHINSKPKISQIAKNQLYNEISFLETAFRSKQELEDLLKVKIYEVKILKQKTRAMKSSKFWKLRVFCLKLKHQMIFIFLHPIKLLKKYLKH